MDYYDWCAMMETRYDTMPQWYWNAATREATYKQQMKLDSIIRGEKNDEENQINS